MDPKLEAVIQDATMNILARDDLPFPSTLPQFQRPFPDDGACAKYLEKAKWPDGFFCPNCGVVGDPFRLTNRPGILICRACRRQTRLLVGTVIERSHTRLSTWFWAAYLVASQTPGMSAKQFQRQLGFSCYETAFGILHKLRAGMVRPDRDRIGGLSQARSRWTRPGSGGRIRGEGHGVHHKTLVAAAVVVRLRKPGTALDKRRGGRYAGRLRLAIASDRSTESLCGFVADAVEAKTIVVTDNWNGHGNLGARGYDHLAVGGRGRPDVAEDNLPIIHLVFANLKIFANLKTWLNGPSRRQRQTPASLPQQIPIRFNRRFYPFNAFRSLPGIARDAAAPTFAELYSGQWQHPIAGRDLR